MNATKRLLLVLLPLLQGAATTEVKCGVGDHTQCVSPEALGRVNFEFKPLFTEPATFVYAFDAENETEVANKPIDSGSSAVPNVKMGFWLEYTKYQLTPTAHMETDMAVLIGENITGTPSGGHNGCDGVWGSECSQNLVAYLKTKVSQARSLDASISSVLGDIQSYNSDRQRYYNGRGVVGRNLSCAADVFDKFYGEYAGTDKLASENGSDNEIEPSRNSSYPHLVEWNRNTTYEQQIDLVAVGLFLRRPLEDKLLRDPDNLQLEIVCAKAEPYKGGDDSNSDNARGSDGGATTGGDSEKKPNSSARPMVWNIYLELVGAAALWLI